MTPGRLLRLAAFSTDPQGGNPAGVWCGNALPPAAEMQRIATRVGDSETAFLAPAGERRYHTRYYSPKAEVSFCGHATIASGIVLGDTHGDGTFELSTAVGVVPVTITTRQGRRFAALTSVEPQQTDAPEALVTQALHALHWSPQDLDTSLPPTRAYAGAWHLVLAVRQAERLARLDYDFEGLEALMLADGLTTLQLVWRQSPGVFVARNPFPVGGIVEDPATGAAAAALGGTLRARGLVSPPASFLIRQGEAMGHPSRLFVEVPPTGGIVVSGTAVPLPIASGAGTWG